MSEPLTGIREFDVRGVEPIAAAVSVGRKSDKGQPIDRDRFYVVLPTATQATYQTRDGRSYNAPKRDLHPSFGAWNTGYQRFGDEHSPDFDMARYKAELARRTIIPARLGHLTIEQCWHGSYFCLEAPKLGKRPNKAPVCVGNGVDADRWINDKIQRIPCPGEQCEFRQKPMVNGKPGKTPCSPKFVMFARFDWPRDKEGKGLPNVPFKIQSQSIYSYLNFVGFFDSFRNACTGFGVDYHDVPLFGLPVNITLQERTNSAAGTVFPVLSLTVAGDGDLLGWVGAQLERRDTVRKLADAARLPALTDRAVIDATYTDADLTDGPLTIPGAK